MLINYTFNKELVHENIRKDIIKGDKIICIKNFPLSDENLNSFINLIGIPIIEYRNNGGNSIFDVKVFKQNNFFRSIANSNLNIPLHTDCADFKSVPNCIGLLCVKPALLEQGVSFFTSLKEILKEASNSKLKELTTKKWKFRNELKPILQKKNEQFSICYDRITIESFSQITDKELEELNSFDELFKKESFEIMLKKGDLILFRNDLFLHGRSHFDLNSERLIKRIRFNVK